jgi:hypothetical protein
MAKKRSTCASENTLPGSPDAVMPSFWQALPMPSVEAAPARPQHATFGLLVLVSKMGEKRHENRSWADFENPRGAGSMLQTLTARAPPGHYGHQRRP